jgi:leucyl-tRNA synthetase
VLVSWQKMSKSKCNGIDPQRIIDDYGADTTRLFVLFKAPPDQELEWDDSAIAGPHRWLNRLLALAEQLTIRTNRAIVEAHDRPDIGADADALLIEQVGIAVERVTADLENHPPQFNTAIASLMKLSNSISSSMAASPRRRIDALLALARMLAPFAPHVAAELHDQLTPASADTVFEYPWPLAVDYRVTIERSTVEVVIQCNGKTRGTFVADIGLMSDPEALELAAIESPCGQRYINADQVTRVIQPKGHNLLNFVQAKSN